MKRRLLDNPGLLIASGVVGGGLPTPAATVVPAINANPVIGTLHTGDDGTWNVAVTFTYQWQRNGVDIVGATNKNYTPIDASFGYSLRLAVTATNAAGVATTAYSNATNLVKEAPAQSLGANQTVNGNFSDGGGTFPNGWTYSVGTPGGDPGVSNSAPDGSAGTGAAKFTSTATNTSPIIRQNALTQGALHQLGINLTAYTSGTLGVEQFSGTLRNFTSAGQKRFLLSADAANVILRLRSGAAPTALVADDVLSQVVTTNVQLTAPSANMRLTARYTFNSPLEGDSVWLWVRINSTANRWSANVEYTGSQYDVTLYSVASNVRTSRTSESNIGANVAVRVNANGDTLKLYTSANGTVFTQRGSNVTLALYNTDTGVNVVWTEGAPVSTLEYAAAD